MQTLHETDHTTPADAEHRRRVSRIIRKRTFCTLATTSPAGYAHGAGVVYQWVDGALWVHVMRSSRKARNVASNPNVGVCIAFRRLPAGPPFTIHFQGRADIVEMDDPTARTLIDAGRLKKISGHGALDAPDGCFLRIVPNGTVHSYGPGANVIDLVRDPLNTGARSVRLDDGEAR
ncbi:MAG: pyridoxamine 5'-phosphate oxidase family protein [Ilumatobacteraceae bacterium]